MINIRYENNVNLINKTSKYQFSVTFLYSFVDDLSKKSERGVIFTW